MPLYIPPDDGAVSPKHADEFINTYIYRYMILYKLCVFVSIYG
jgi:hypothetical protein